MSRYSYSPGKHSFDRKNLHLPCLIAAEKENKPGENRSGETLAKVLWTTYWTDNLTATEWPVALQHDGVKGYIRSKLKKKAAGWLVALGRIAAQNPELAREICTKARAMYLNQIDEEYPWHVITAGLSGLPVYREVHRDEDETALEWKA